MRSNACTLGRPLPLLLVVLEACQSDGRATYPRPSPVAFRYQRVGPAGSPPPLWTGPTLSRSLTIAPVIGPLPVAATLARSALALSPPAHSSGSAALRHRWALTRPRPFGGPSAGFPGGGCVGRHLRRLPRPTSHFSPTLQLFRSPRGRGGRPAASAAPSGSRSAPVTPTVLALTSAPPALPTALRSTARSGRPARTIRSRPLAPDCRRAGIYAGWPRSGASFAFIRAGLLRCFELGPPQRRHGGTKRAPARDTGPGVGPRVWWLGHARVAVARPPGAGSAAIEHKRGEVTGARCTSA